MSEQAGVTPAEGRPRRGAARALLALGSVVAVLVVLVAYGFNAEYGDTGATRSTLARDALVAWIPAYAVVAGILAAAVALARTRGVAVAAGAVLLVTVAAVPAAVVTAVEVKYDRYDATPGCTGATDAGPLSGRAQRVLERAEAEFASLEHPGPFSGGGWSGVDGCESGLMLRAGADPVAVYRVTLPEAGWTVTEDRSNGLRATKGDEGFRLRMRDGAWAVRIGPRGRTP